MPDNELWWTILMLLARRSRLGVNSVENMIH